MLPIFSPEHERYVDMDVLRSYRNTPGFCFQILNVFVSKKIVLKLTPLTK